MEGKQMKKILAIVFAMALVLPVAFAVDTGMGLGINIETEDFPPLIWMCDNRCVHDDFVEDGRVSEGGEWLAERQQNYAFEGEQIMWTVLVMDKNGIEKIEDLYVSVGPIQGNGEYIEANCEALGCEADVDFHDCNARIDEEWLDECDPSTMSYYRCVLTVESPASMHGEYWVTANVVDLDGLLGTMDENEFWFLNPVVALTISGTPLNFGTVRPGTSAYSNTITVGNGAESGSGVMMDMFITGTDFTDPMHSGAKCPSSNVLRLWGAGPDGDIYTRTDNTGLRYFATNGAYSTLADLQLDPLWGTHGSVQRHIDAEGYVNIEYGNYFSTALYNNAEVIQNAPMVGPYYSGNILSPGSELSVTFKLNLPEPCNGDFSDGSIYFWGEAI
jgi:hypothetical protein